jgi:hypothetical protein
MGNSKMKMLNLDDYLVSECKIPFPEIKEDIQAVFFTTGIFDFLEIMIVQKKLKELNYNRKTVLHTIKRFSKVNIKNLPVYAGTAFYFKTEQDKIQFEKKYSFT